jgi:tetratricopeptide (TPR) repeat protein
MHIGNLYAEAGDAEQAKEYYEKAIEGYEMLLSENPEATDFEISISDIIISIGDMYAKVGDEETEPEDAELETAREYYEKALKLNEKEFERYSDDLTCQDELIRILGKLGDTFTVQDRYEDAIPFYRRIVEIKEQVVRKNPRSWLNINALTNFLYQLGSYYGKIEEVELERKQYSKAAELYSRVLHDKNLQLPIKQVLAVEVQSHGIDLLKSRKYDAAEEALDLALEFFESLYEEDPEDAENYPYICEALYQSGNLQKDLGNFEEAAKSFDSLLPIVEKLLESDPESPETRENAGDTYTNAGEVYFLTGEYEKSKQAFEKALTINAALLEEDPDNPIYRIDQAEAFEKYAKLLAKLGRNEEAEDYITKSEGIYRKLAEEESDEGDINE